MVKKYSREPGQPDKACKASASELRVHYKNTYNTARAIKGMSLLQAKNYLKDVLAHNRCVPYLKYYGGIGRTAQAKEFKKTLGRWPEKSVRVLLGLVQNLEANAKQKRLDTDTLTINHVQTNRAPKGRRRTYRAHGRIGPYLSSQTHIELWANQVQKDVRKEGKKKQLAKGKIPVG
jgi:large subunit ribosomal protein L17e